MLLLAAAALPLQQPLQQLLLINSRGIGIWMLRAAWCGAYLVLAALLHYITRCLLRENGAQQRSSAICTHLIEPTMIYPTLQSQSIQKGINLQTPPNPVINFSIHTGTIGANNTVKFK